MGKVFHQRPNKKAIEHDGYFFWIKSTDPGGIKYLKCRNSSGPSPCPATATMNVAGIIRLRKGHECVKEEDTGFVAEFEAAIFTEISSDPHRYARLIYDKVAESHQRGSILRPFVQMKQKMAKWRRRFVPRLPKSLDDYVNLINSPCWINQYTNYNGGQLTVTCIRGADGSKSVIFADINYLRSLQVEDFHLDATFKVCPRRPNVLQLLTLMATVDNAAVPIAWVLMTRKTVGSYVAVLKYFKTVAAPHWRPKTFTIDFERALSSAILRIYSNVRIIRCFFHYCQCLTKYLMKCRGKKEFKNLKDWPRGLLFFRKLMSLALLPSVAIIQAFEELIQSTEADVICYFDELIAYYRRWWINTVGPRRFSVHPFSKRTNNVIEAYHRVLGVRMQVHPTIWQFTYKLRQLQQVSRNEMLAFNEGLEVRDPPTRQSSTQNAIITRAWELYADGLFDNGKFLTAASHFLKTGGKKYLISNPQELDIFRSVLTYDEIVNRFNIPRLFAVDESIELERGDMIALRPLDVYRCLFCQAVRVATCVSLPCWHWFSCSTCVPKIMTSAAQQNHPLACNSCYTVCTEIREVSTNP